MSFINPGIKIAYELGGNGRLKVGLEVSYSVWSKDADVYSVAIGIDNWDELFKLRIGLEGQRRMLGVMIGPAFLLQDSVWSVGLAMSVFTGMIVYPYCEMTMRFDEAKNIYELGSYVKLPLNVGGKKFSF